jgi:uncharacterized alpha-E superfamily protein
MLSRIADSLFWMTRYVERADGILRMLKINFITSLDQTSVDDFSWQPVLKVFTPLPAAEIAAFSHRPNDVLRYMITSKENKNSIRNIITLARENARGMQDHITKEAWECMNEFYHHVNSPHIDHLIEQDEQITVLTDLIRQCTLFYGVAEVTMPRGQGWNYMNLGKFIERGIQTIDILDVKFSDIHYDLADPAGMTYYRNLLLSLSGYELYLKTYRVGLDSQNVVDMALLNTNFPRSVLYCLVRIDRYIQKLPLEDEVQTQKLQKITGRLRALVEYSDLESITQKGLHDYLSEIRMNLYAFSNTLGRTYFAYH